MAHRLEFLLLSCALGAVVGHSSHVALPTSCGPLHAYITHRLTAYDKCQTRICCCEYVQRRPLLTVLSIISGSNECSSQLNRLLVAVNQKCANHSITFDDCPQDYRKFFIIRRTYSPNTIENADSVRPQRTRVERTEVGWHWLSLVMAVTVIASFLVVLYLAKTLVKSELKQPLNAIHDPKKKKGVPNLYSSV